MLSHKKHYANDKNGTTKLIVTTKEVGTSTLEKNTFGNCTKQSWPYPPCKPNITVWENFYNQVTFSNDGNLILEDSKAICAIAGEPCIEIIDHGQRAEANAQNFKNTNPDVQQQLNPLVSPEDFYNDLPKNEGIEIE